MRSPDHSLPDGRSALLDAALKRLLGALDHLEAATGRLGSVEGGRRDLEDTLALMQDDRGRLAEELDTAMTRNRALEQATDDVATRLGNAGATLRRLLAVAEGDA